jgi:hypothetical protein
MTIQILKQSFVYFRMLAKPSRRMLNPPDGLIYSMGQTDVGSSVPSESFVANKYQECNLSVGRESRELST